VVTSTRSDRHLTIVARPDRSATWRTNVLLLAALAAPCLGAASLFAVAGAWPILPLAGAEMLGLGGALYWVNRKLQYRHVITVSDETVTIAKGYRSARQSWQFPRAAAGLTIVPERHPWEGPELSLHDRHESVPLGEFLGREDQLALIELLRGEIRVRAQSCRTCVEF